MTVSPSAFTDSVDCGPAPFFQVKFSTTVATPPVNRNARPLPSKSKTAFPPVPLMVMSWVAGVSRVMSLLHAPL